MAVWYLPAFRDWLIELVGELAHYAVEGEAAQTDAAETGPDAVVEAVPKPTADLEPVRSGEPMENGFARFFPHGSDPEVLPKPVVVGSPPGSGRCPGTALPGGTVAPAHRPDPDAEGRDRPGAGGTRNPRHGAVHGRACRHVGRNVRTAVADAEAA